MHYIRGRKEDTGEISVVSIIEKFHVFNNENIKYKIIAYQDQRWPAARKKSVANEHISNFIGDLNRMYEIHEKA